MSKGRYLGGMKAQCIITFRTDRTKDLSIWKSVVQGADHLSIASDAIEKLRKRQRRRVTVVGIMVHTKDQVTTRS